MKIKLIKDCNLGKEIGFKNQIIEVDNNIANKLLSLNFAYIVLNEEPIELIFKQEEPKSKRGKK